MKLKTILRPSVVAIAELLSHFAIKATKIASLASLLMLAKVNDNIDDPDFFAQDAKDMVEECFFEVLNPIKTKQGHRRQPKFPNYVSQQFAQTMHTHKIARPNNDNMGNMFRYLHQMYAGNFKTNICLHGWKRIFNFFKTLPNSTKIQRRSTMKYLFDESSKCQPAENLIAALDALPHHTFHNWHRGALQRFENEWFSYVPLFIAIQRHVYDYNMTHAEEWRQQDEETKAARKTGKIKRKYPRIRPMNIVPIMKFRRQHVRIDSEALFHVFSVLKQLPKKTDNNRRNITVVEFKARQHEFWSRFFNMERIEEIRRGTKNKKEFAFQIQTDGVSVSLLYNAVPKRRVNAEEKIHRIRNNYQNNQYRYETSIDVGYNTYIAAIRRSVDSGKELNLTLKSRRFHRNTKNNLRKKKFDRLAGDFEKAAALDRENRQLYPEMPTPTGSHMWWHYIRHSLKHWSKAIETYTVTAYAEMAFDKYTNTQKQIDGIVKLLTNGGEPTLLLIGGKKMDTFGLCIHNYHLRALCISLCTFRRRI